MVHWFLFDIYINTIVYYERNMTCLTVLVMNIYSYPNVLLFIFL